MNIQQAKEEVKRTVHIYLARDEVGEYIVPTVRQRPVFLIGAPGIGKTAIMEQIAAEMEIGLVSYAMTHHTRQSAIGLPFISEKRYGDETVRISEYTMSEILASVYNLIQESGKREGILFLDEINCLSETLAPSMLQFLQYKTFGNRRLPDGWVIVTAGNPPQYNKAVHEFDIATRDRLKYIPVEEDYDVWKKYAYTRGIHAAILAFLEVNRKWFYSIRTTADGPQFATGRGWEDLSQAMRLYEANGYPVELTLIAQYITDSEISHRFAMFYDLHRKYREEYRIEEILRGEVPQTVLELAQKALFDERIAVLELIQERLNQDFVDVIETWDTLENAAKILRESKKAAGGNDSSELARLLACRCDALAAEWRSKKSANSLDAAGKRRYQLLIRKISEYAAAADASAEKSKPDDTAEKQYKRIQKRFKAEASACGKKIRDIQGSLESVFDFLHTAWGEAQEMTYFLTILTENSHSSTFIHRWGCESYYRYNDKLLVYDNTQKLQQELLLLDSRGAVPGLFHLDGPVQGRAVEQEFDDEVQPQGGKENGRQRPIDRGEPPEPRDEKAEGIRKDDP